MNRYMNKFLNQQMFKGKIKEEIQKVYQWKT